MVDEPKPALTNYVERDTAPLIFFDEAPFLGTYNGIVSVTLAATFNQPGPNGEPKLNTSVVGYLRSNIQGAMALRAALDQAILAAMPTKGEAN